MGNIHNQFQSDVANAASGLMTQMMCAERGINYEQLMQAAQSAHLNGILLAEQQRQQDTIVKRHYQGNTIMGKVRDVFAPAQPMTMFSPQPVQQGYGAAPMGYGQPAIQGFNQFNQPMNPQQASQYLVAQQPVAAPIAPTPVVEPAVQDIKSLVESLVHDALKNMTTQPAPVQPAYPATNTAPLPVTGSADINI